MTRQNISTSKQDWSTPDYFFQALHREFSYDVDLMAAWYNTKLPKFIGPGSSLSEDIFSQPWGKVRGWCNPEYRLIQKCLERAVEETEKYGAFSTWLLPSNTDTKWFHEIATRALVEFVRGRIRFENRTPPDIEAARLLRLKEQKGATKKLCRELSLCVSKLPPEARGADSIQESILFLEKVWSDWRTEKPKKDNGPAYGSLLVHIGPSTLDRNLPFGTRLAKTGERL